MEDKFRKNQAILEEVIRRMTLYDLETYNPLSMNFNNIAKWQNLMDLNLSNNRIGHLPFELGTLPFLQKLNLSQNCIRIFFQYKWLEQTAIKNNLLSLDISKNFITELPYCIMELNALKRLNVSHNMLSCLPHTIAHLQNLELLDVSHNSLLYLPKEFTNLRLKYLIIAKNLCVIDERKRKKGFKRLLNVIEWVINSGFLPNLLGEYTNTIRQCFNCKQYCIEWYMQRITQLSLNSICQYTITGPTSKVNHRLVLVDYITCYPSCKRSFDNKLNKFTS